MIQQWAYMYLKRGEKQKGKKKKKKIPPKQQQKRKKIYEKHTHEN